MARSAILGNGRLTVGLNEKGLVHDFYYPYVGLDNLTTARSIHHKIGVSVNGKFSWTDDNNWICDVDLLSDAQMTDITMTNTKLNLTLKLTDFVDYEYDAFCRRISVVNNTDETADIKLFMHQVFEISRAGRADTALFVPDEHYILDYKGRCCLLINGTSPRADKFDQFAVGNYGIEGKEGTFVDAEDGELSGHPVEHGGVDSVIRFSLDVAAGGEEIVDYWIIASDAQFNAEATNVALRSGLDDRIETNRLYWKTWLEIGEDRLSGVSEKDRKMLNKSLMVIKAHADQRGGIIASCDSSIYNFGRDYYSYVWPRDGAYAVWPLIRLGYTEEPKAFFRFCKEILTLSGYLMHKYQPDKAIGSTWHPLLHNNRRELAIQEDETAIIIIMLGEYMDTSGDSEFIKEMYSGFILPAADFLCDFRDQTTGLPHASYDLWEEKFLCSTYTTATVYRALLTAADFAEKYSSNSSEKTKKWRQTAEDLLSLRQTFVNPDRAGFRKGFLLQEDGSLQFDNTLDLSSLYGVVTYGYYTEDDRPYINTAIAEIEETLLNKTASGGTPRYEHDNYFRVSDKSIGNPWVISTLWMAQFYVRYRQFDKVKPILEWVHSKALPSGMLPEQVHPETGEPISVTPLVWSHAEFVNTVLDLAYIKKSSEN